MALRRDEVESSHKPHRERWSPGNDALQSYARCGADDEIVIQGTRPRNPVCCHELRSASCGHAYPNAKPNGYRYSHGDGNSDAHPDTNSADADADADINSDPDPDPDRDANVDGSNQGYSHQNA